MAPARLDPSQLHRLVLSFYISLGGCGYSMASSFSTELASSEGETCENEKIMETVEVPNPFIYTCLPDSFEKVSDMVIEVDGERYASHQAIIRKASPVFNVMMGNGMKESVTKEISIKEISKESWEKAFEFIYTADICIEEEEIAFEIAEFADFYNMPLLLSEADEALEKYVTKNNAIERLSFAVKLGLQDVRESSKRIISQLFLNLCETIQFKKLPFRIVEEILKIDDLAILTALDIFQAINGWVKCSSETIDADPDTLIDWKRKEAKKLFKYMDYKRIDFTAMKNLSNHHATANYPNLMRDVISDLRPPLHESEFTTRRYEPALAPKRITIVLVATYSLAAWKITESHIGEKMGTEIHLEATKDRYHHLTSEIVTEVKNIQFVELFLLERGKKLIRTVTDPLALGCSFGSLNRSLGDCLVFGANIFLK